jgi:hypothetical protein
MQIKCSSQLGWLIAAGLVLVASPALGDVAPVSDDEAAEIAIDAYIYAYPLVLMDVSRQVMNGAGTKSGLTAPLNQFHHMRTFPDATFTAVVRPNADTLYSSLWFDVTKEPLVIDVPDSGGRYYLLPMMDFWTDIFASPGKRTTGTGPQRILLVGPHWEGTVPDGVEFVRAPTGSGWLIGRTQTDGKADYPNVHKFQAGLNAAPLHTAGGDHSPAQLKADPSISREAPGEQVAKMSAATFFAHFAEATRDNPPHANDYPILSRMKRIGLEPGRSFDFARATQQTQAALEKAVPVAQDKIKGYLTNSSRQVDGWGMVMSPIGTYGTDYLKRALIANMGLGANTIEDAFYPTANAQADGKPFESSQKYRLHFTADEIPPARAFWSLTMYNDRQFFAANPINRYAIGDRDKLKFDGDGSLTLYIQRESPGKDLESNWLPAPQSGNFTMNLRLYWPKPAALDGTWKPPAIQRVTQ